MKQPTQNTTLMLALGILLAFSVVADDSETPGADMAAMEKAMEQAMTPGEPHRFLEGLVGEWSFTSTLWMDPSQPPMKSDGVAKKTMIMGGRYLQEEVSGEMMGQAFNGRGVTAYDNVGDEFLSTWIDDMATGILVCRGQRDGSTLTVRGDYTDPMSRQPMKVRMVTRIVDKDHHVFEYFMTMPGAPEQKSMEIEYVRKAGE